MLASLGALKGWQAMFGHMASRERAPFTAAYVGSLAATLYAAMVAHSYVLSLLSCAAQVVALVYYVVSFFPGGASGAGYVLRGSLSVGSAVLRSALSR
jgi:hypothetical protein